MTQAQFVVFIVIHQPLGIDIVRMANPIFYFWHAFLYIILIFSKKNLLKKFFDHVDKTYQTSFKNIQADAPLVP